MKTSTFTLRLDEQLENMLKKATELLGKIEATLLVKP